MHEFLFPVLHDMICYYIVWYTTVLFGLATLMAVELKHDALMFFKCIKGGIG